MVEGQGPYNGGYRVWSWLRAKRGDGGSLPGDSPRAAVGGRRVLLIIRRGGGFQHSGGHARLLGLDDTRVW
jgi:hypothetical protein